MASSASFFLTACSQIVVFAVTQEVDDLCVSTPSSPRHSFPSAFRHSFHPFCGFLPGLMAVVVAYKQAYPQATLRLAPVPLALDPKVRGRLAPGGS